MCAIAQKYICNGCDTLYDNTIKCDELSSLCTDRTPFTKDQNKHPGSFNRWFISEKCFRII